MIDIWLIDYFSPAHLLYIAIAAAFVAGLYFILKRVSPRTQKMTVAVIMLLNFTQHIFKMQIYPQYNGGVSLLSTAYNICALLILVSPFIYFSKFKFLKDFIFCLGSAAGTVAILIPYWNIGEPAFTWEIYRFFICHVLLLAGSVLPLLLGHHKPSWKSFSKFGLAFLASLFVIILNDIVFIFMGMAEGYSPDRLYEALMDLNPAWSFVPPKEFPFVAEIAKALSPNFLVESSFGVPVPVLWYAIPVYIGITLAALPVCALVDRRNFTEDMKRYKRRAKELLSKTKSLFNKNNKGEDE